MFKAVKAFQSRGDEYKGALDITQQTRGQLTDFQKYAPLVASLRSEGMKDRHWLQVSD